MTDRPVLPPLPPLPVRGFEEAVREGRRRRRQALLPVAALVSVLAVVAAAQVVAGAGDPDPDAVAAALPGRYVAIAVDTRVGGDGGSLSVRSTVDGSVLAEVAPVTDRGRVASVDRSGDDLVLVRGAGDAGCPGHVLRWRAGVEELLFSLPEGQAVTRLQVSPDGTRAAYVRVTCRDGVADQGTGAVRLLELATGGDFPAYEDRVGSEALAWSPDGDRLAVLRESGAVVLSSTRPPREAPVVPSPQVPLALTPGCRAQDLAWTAAGLHTVEVCDGEDPLGPRTLLTVDAPAQTDPTPGEVGPARRLPLPPCTYALGLSADDATGALLLWLQGLDRCPAPQPLVRVEDGGLVDVALQAGPGIVVAATW